MPTLGREVKPLEWAQKELETMLKILRRDPNYDPSAGHSYSQMLTLNISGIEQLTGKKDMFLGIYEITPHENLRIKDDLKFIYRIDKYKDDLGWTVKTDDEIIKFCKEDPYAILYPPIASRIVALRLMNTQNACNIAQSMLTPYFRIPQDSGQRTIKLNTLAKTLRVLIEGYEYFLQRFESDNTKRSLKIKEKDALAQLQLRGPEIFRRCNWSWTKRKIIKIHNLAETARWYVRYNIAENILLSGNIPKIGLIHPYIADIFFDRDALGQEITWFKAIQQTIFPGRKYEEGKYCLVIYNKDFQTLYKMGNPEEIKNKINLAIISNPGPHFDPLFLYKYYIQMEASINRWGPNCEKWQNNEIIPDPEASKMEILRLYGLRKGIDNDKFRFLIK